MPIRLLAVDLDGTLLNGKSELSAANRQALRAAAGRGVQVVVVTGRRCHSAKIYVDQIPCPVVLIASNGARIGAPSGEVFHRNFLPRHLARGVLEATWDFRPYAVAIFDTPERGQVIMEESAVSEGPLGWYLKNSLRCLLQVPDLPAAISTDPVQVMFGGPPSRIEPAEALLRDSSAGASVHLTWTKYLDRNTSILDVMNKGCSKGSALKLWAERCGIHHEEIMAIGDNFNDLEMLEYSGHPVVMANSSPGLRRNGWIMTLSNDQDGVARAIEAHVLSD